MITYSIPKTIESWNSFLWDRFGYGLYEFSYTLADTIVNKNSKYGLPLQTKLPKILLMNRNEYLRDEIKMMENLKSYIIRRLFDYLKSTGWWDGIKEPSEKIIDDIIEIFELLPFFKHLDKEIEGLKEHIQGKGRPQEIRNLIVSIWAEVMKDKEKAYWPIIEGLLLWFYHRLKKTRYCEILGSDSISKTDFDRVYLRNAYYRIKRDEQKSEYLNFLRNKYFPQPREYPWIYIEFNKEYIDFVPVEKGGLLLKFPDGDTYRAEY